MTGRCQVDRDTLQTSNPKVFACGDVIFGKGSRGSDGGYGCPAREKRLPIICTKA